MWSMSPAGMVYRQAMVACVVLTMAMRLLNMVGVVTKRKWMRWCIRDTKRENLWLSIEHTVMNDFQLLLILTGVAVKEVSFVDFVNLVIVLSSLLLLRRLYSICSGSNFWQRRSWIDLLVAGSYILYVNYCVWVGWIRFRFYIYEMPDSIKWIFLAMYSSSQYDAGHRKVSP